MNVPEVAITLLLWLCGDGLKLATRGFIGVGSWRRGLAASAVVLAVSAAVVQLGAWSMR